MLQKGSLTSDCRPVWMLERTRQNIHEPALPGTATSGLVEKCTIRVVPGTLSRFLVWTLVVHYLEQVLGGFWREAGRGRVGFRQSFGRNLGQLAEDRGWPGKSRLWVRKAESLMHTLIYFVEIEDLASNSICVFEVGHCHILSTSKMTHSPIFRSPISRCIRFSF